MILVFPPTTITPISDFIDHYVIIQFFKKIGKNKVKLRTIYAKNHEKFEISKPSGSYKKSLNSPRVVQMPVFRQVLGIFFLASSTFFSKVPSYRLKLLQWHVIY